MSAESSNPCPNQRAISRPLLFVHNYSLFFFGFILNFVAFMILMQSALRSQSTFAYLAFLSLSNGLLSFGRFIQWMVTYYFNIHFEDNLYTCRFYHFTLDFLTHFSLFTLVCVNIDRARTVTKRRVRRTFSNSAFHSVLIKELIIAAVLCAYHFHWLIKFGHQVFDNGVQHTICNYHHNHTPPKYFYFLSTVYPLFELIIFFCLPLFVNMLCTILIVRSLHSKMRTAKRFVSKKYTSANSREQPISTKLGKLCSCLIPTTTTKLRTCSCFCFQMQCRRHTTLRLKIARTQQSLIEYERARDTTEQPQLTTTGHYFVQDLQPIVPTSSAAVTTMLNKNQRSRRLRDIQLSAMLITLNILYLLCNLPFNFHQTFGRRLYENNTDLCIMRFTHVLLDILQQTYFSTNFFLYVLANRRFREECCKTIMKLLSRRQRTLIKENHRRPRSSLTLLEPTAGITNMNVDQPLTQTTAQPNLFENGSDGELTQTSI